MHKARFGEIPFSVSTLAILNCFMLEATSSHPYGFSQSNSLIIKAQNQAKKSLSYITKGTIFKDMLGGDGYMKLMALVSLTMTVIVVVLVMLIAVVVVVVVLMIIFLHSTVVKVIYGMVVMMVVAMMVVAMMIIMAIVRW